MIENLGVYDKSKIGKLISFGIDHIVYNYNGDKVIKFPIAEFLMGNNGRKKVERDYLICKQFFGKFILDTEFKTSPNGKRIADIQPKITGHYLAKADLKDEFINSQFREIMEAYGSLIAAGNAKIDFVGKDGIFRNCMSNIFVTPDRKLLIIDATLLDGKQAGFLKLLFFLIIALANWINNKVIRNFTS